MGRGRNHWLYEWARISFKLGEEINASTRFKSDSQKKQNLDCWKHPARQKYPRCIRIKRTEPRRDGERPLFSKADVQINRKSQKRRAANGQQRP